MRQVTIGGACNSARSSRTNTLLTTFRLTDAMQPHVIFPSRHRCETTTALATLLCFSPFQQQTVSTVELITQGAPQYIHYPLHSAHCMLQTTSHSLHATAPPSHPALRTTQFREMVSPTLVAVHTHPGLARGGHGEGLVLGVVIPPQGQQQSQGGRGRRAVDGHWSSSPLPPAHPQASGIWYAGSAEGVSGWIIRKLGPKCNPK